MQSMFFAMCIDNKKVEHLLTVGKIYEIQGNSLWLMLVETDQGNLEWLGKYRFNVTLI